MNTKTELTLTLDNDTLQMITEAIELEKNLNDPDYCKKLGALEEVRQCDHLEHLQLQIAWSVMYDVQQLPF